jgi:hypothetical protein
MEERIAIPERIENLIGYGAWTALSWALQNQWVQEYKWLFSRSFAFGDVGVPETVKRMTGEVYWIDPSNHFLGGTRTFPYGRDLARGAWHMFNERCPIATDDVFKKLMMEGYLLGTDFVSPLWVMKPNGRWKPTDLVQTGVVCDEHGQNQLEGELRRHWAYWEHIPDPRSVTISMAVIERYCSDNKLQGLEEKFAQSLKVFY